GHQRTGWGADRSAADADVVVALANLLDAALHLQHQGVLDGALQLAAAGDLMQEGVPVDAQLRGHAVVRAARAGSEQTEQQRGDGYTGHSQSPGNALRTAPRNATAPIRANRRNGSYPHAPCEAPGWSQSLNFRTLRCAQDPGRLGYINVVVRDSF